MKCGRIVFEALLLGHLLRAGPLHAGENLFEGRGLGIRGKGAAPLQFDPGIRNDICRPREGGER